MKTQKSKPFTKRMPKNAKRVFSGVIFDVYQWKQKLFDGSYATFERLKRNDSAVIIPTIGGKILLAEEEQPLKPTSISMIGGMGEDEETPIETAKRELLEETGCVSDDWELLKTYVPSAIIGHAINLFVARNCEKVQEQRLDAGEKIKVLKVGFDEFMSLISENAAKRGMVALEMYYVGLIKSKRLSLKKKIFGTGKENPLKISDYYAGSVESLTTRK